MDSDLSVNSFKTSFNCFRNDREIVKGYVYFFQHHKIARERKKDLNQPKQTLESLCVENRNWYEPECINKYVKINYI